MRAVPFDVLENAVIANNLGFSVVPDGNQLGSQIQSTVSKKFSGITFFSDYNTRSANGQFLKVPFLVGNNANEGDVFAVAAEELALSFTVPVATQVLSDLITQV